MLATQPTVKIHDYGLNSKSMRQINMKKMVGYDGSKGLSYTNDTLPIRLADARWFSMRCM
jgi:hypothetical protein